MSNDAASLLANRSGAVVSAAVLVIAAAAVLLSRIWIPAFALAGAALLAVVGYAALRWPRGVLVAVSVSAIIDRYVVAGLLPSSLGFAAHLSSEALLAVTAVVITLVSWRQGRIVAAIWHPATPFLLAFVALAVASALLSGDPPIQALAGIAFTLDAALLFFLARMVGFTVRQGLLAAAGLVGLLLAAALIAIAQAVVRPDIFGLTALIGRFGEVYRLASIFGDPNVFAALISAALPFAATAAVRAPRPRDRWICLLILFLLILPLWLSFSRGGWLGVAVGFSAATLVLDRHVLVVGVAVLAIGFGVAAVMPRDLGGSVPGQARPDLIGSTTNRITSVGEDKDLRTLFIRNALPIVADHPLLGVGPGRYGGAVADIFGTPVYHEYATDQLFTNPSQRTVDDFWLHLAVESGLLGTLAFVGALVAIAIPIVRAAWRSRARKRIVLVGICAACAALAVNSTTTMLLEANSVAFVFWFLLGIGSTIAQAGRVSELPAGDDLPEGTADDPDVSQEGPLIDVFEV